jgi:hypothetical protein
MDLTRTNFFKPQTLAYHLDTAVDRRKLPIPDQETKALLATTMGGGGAWRLSKSSSAANLPRKTTEEKFAEKEMLRKSYRPREAPSWLKHDRQVLRFNCYFQEGVKERKEENCRFRHCVIFFYLEDGTMQITEPKVENSGLPQGAMVKRHVINKPDGSGPYTPYDLACGKSIEVYCKLFRITDCDGFTKWFYAKSGIEIGTPEEAPTDEFDAAMALKKAVTTKAFGVPREVIEGAYYNELKLGGARKNIKLEQFMKNDGRVLRFYCFWDDSTRYGCRNYYVLHYFLADNTVEILDKVARNSGKDPYPLSYKRAPLKKVNTTTIVPGMLEPDPEVYKPDDLIVWSTFDFYGREVFIYDCDDSTRAFYKDYMGIEQAKMEIPAPVMEPIRLPYPPHTGVGSEEDSLASCIDLRPKIPKKDVVRLMTNAGKILRFEARMMNMLQEDENRRFIIGVYLQDNHVAVWERRTRNSGFLEGKFTEKKRRKNPETGLWFEPKDFYVGASVTIASAPLLISRADEYSLKEMEAKGYPEFPMSDITMVLAKIAGLKGDPGFATIGTVDPDSLQEYLRTRLGVWLADQEVITLLRALGEPGNDQPVIRVESLLARLG